MGRESRNNPTAQDAREGKLISRASMMGRIDRALENHALAIRVARQKIETLEARVAVLEGLHNVERVTSVETIGFVEAHPQMPDGDIARFETVTT